MDGSNKHRTFNQEAGVHVSKVLLSYSEDTLVTFVTCFPYLCYVDYIFSFCTMMFFLILPKWVCCLSLTVLGSATAYVEKLYEDQIFGG